MSQKNNNYPACDHIKRTKPNQDVDKEVLDKFLKDSDVLPIAENKKYDYIRRRHYSLVRNDFLRCRWKEFKEKTGGRRRTPFMFPNVDDFHFYLYQTRYAPAQSHRVLIKGGSTKM